MAERIRQVLAQQPASLRRELEEPETFAALQKSIRTACAAHPSFESFVSPLFEAMLRGRSEGTPMLEHLKLLHSADLLVTVAAAAKEPRAMALIEAELHAQLETVKRRAGAAQAAEVAQAVRLRLFMNDGQRPPALQQYSGRGALKNWLRVTAGREQHRHAGDAERFVDLDAVEGKVATANPELEYMQLLYGQSFRAIFREALAALSSRQRNLLRYAYLDHLAVEQIAAMHGVHRVSASRWLSDAREALAEGIRHRLKGKLQLSGSDERSLLRWVTQRPEVSLSPLLLDEQP